MMQSKLEPVEDDPPRILVVDDEPLVRFAIADALRDHGVTVVEAATADEAWKHLEVEWVDLVFTDHRMPGSMTGAQFAAKLAQRWPDLPVVMTSGDFDGRGFPGILLRKPYAVMDVASQLAKLALSSKRGAGA